MIFRDPTRGLVFAGITTVPPTVPSDRLAGLLTNARSAFERFVIVLVCVHALNGTDIRRLHLSDLDLPRERLLVRRAGRRHIVYLDEITYRSVCEWTRERHRRWPRSPNPHLLINRWTAVDPKSAITPSALHKTFEHTAMRYITAAHPERTAKLSR